MAMNIKHQETEQLARRLSELTGKSLRECVTDALRNAYERESSIRRSKNLDLPQRLNAIIKKAHQLPVIDKRSAEEVLGYNHNGVFD